jgi:hypothetical protein
MDLIGLLITVLIIGLVFGLIFWLLGQFPLPAPFMMVAKAVLAIIAIMLLLGMIFGGVNVPTLRLR